MAIDPEPLDDAPYIDSASQDPDATDGADDGE